MDGHFSMTEKLLRVTRLVKMTVDLKALDLLRGVRLQVNQVQPVQTSFQQHHLIIRMMDTEG